MALLSSLASGFDEDLMRDDIDIASSISRAASSTRTRQRESKGSGEVGLGVLFWHLFVQVE